jgi:hypothetical protein
VIPKWLQRRYDLWDQQLRIPNGATVHYRKLQIPSCERCNSVVFGDLERRVSEGSASDADVWRWANKIHFGLALKDQIYAWDRANPRYRISEVIRPDDPLEQSRHFLHCVSGDFKTDPDPYGSVFTFRFAEPQDFWFAHLIESSSMCVSLGDVGHVVFVRDGQINACDPHTRADYERIRSGGNLADMKFFYAQCVEHMARHTLGFDIVMSRGFLARVGRLVVHDERPVDKPLFRRICKEFGINWVDSNPDGAAE